MVISGDPGSQSPRNEQQNLGTNLLPGVMSAHDSSFTTCMASLWAKYLPNQQIWRPCPISFDEEGFGVVGRDSRSNIIT